MRKVLIAAGVVLGIPVATLVWLYLFSGKVVLVRNGAANDVQVAAVAYNGAFFERTDPKPLAAHGFTWIVFFPHVKGGLTLTCTSDRGSANLPLGTPEQGAPMFSNLTLQTCESNSQSPITPPSPG